MGGIAAARLAELYGTPLLVIDLNAVDRAIASSASVGPNVEVAYAAKAFATVEFVRHLRRHRIGLDVCSVGELVTAERAELPPERLTLHGAGKTDEELRAACDGRVGLIAVDGLEELERLASLARRGCRAGVLLRLNVGIGADTHAFVRTGDDTKFGIPVDDESAARAILQANPGLRFAGLHAHVGSQIRDEHTYFDNAEALCDAAKRFADAGMPVERLVAGGGFAVATNPGDASRSLELGATLAAVADRIAEGCVRRGLAAPVVGFEPGRAIVALAGTTLYRVLAVKRQSRRTFVVVDGGIAENPRPALYGARHHVAPVAPRTGEDAEMILCGRSCENDELGTVRLSHEIATGDLLAMCATGAYTYSMSGNYNRFPRPAVVGILDATVRLLARRESLEDVLRNDAVEETGHASAQAPAAF